MAHRGPEPKLNKIGRTPSADWLDVADLPNDGPWPELPALPRKRKWHELATRSWEQIRVMPHTRLWTDTDWTFCHETILLKHYWFTHIEAGTQTVSEGIEIRRREDQIGTTMESRRKLRIRYVDPDKYGDDHPGRQAAEVRPVGPGTVTSMDDRRQRMLATGT